jgi:hypothetical protein
MKIQIKNREAIETMEFAPKTALISITDDGWHFAELRSKPDYLLQLAFDDVDNDIFIGRKSSEEERKQIEAKYHMLSDNQAQQIAEFYNEICGKVETIICQCEHGQSRSAAVAAAILEFRGRRGIRVFAHDNYYPNKAVFNKVFKQLCAHRKPINEDFYADLLMEQREQM